MSNYLSIGQVAQIKNVNIKSLRYYDKIGVLKPAYTDPSTGYRYYTTEQMIFVDIIQLFISLEIPLKSFPEFIDEDGGFHLDKLLTTGKFVAERKLSTIFNNLERIEMASRDLKTIAPYVNHVGTHRREIPERHLLIMPIEHHTQPAQFQQKLTQLNLLAKTWHVSTNFAGGLMLEYMDGTPKYYIHVQLYSPLEHCPNYRYIPGGTYDCLKDEPGTIYDAPEKYPEYFTTNNPLVIFEVDYLANTLYIESPKVEVHLPVIS